MVLSLKASEQQDAPSSWQSIKESVCDNVRSAAYMLVVPPAWLLIYCLGYYFDHGALEKEEQKAKTRK
jgi:hypothetical protein